MVPYDWMQDTFKNTDIAMYTETHQRVGKSLPHVHGYRWESVYCPQLCTVGGTRGFGGVAVPFRKM